MRQAIRDAPGDSGCARRFGMRQAIRGAPGDSGCARRLGVRQAIRGRLTYVHSL